MLAAVEAQTQRDDDTARSAVIERPAIGLAKTAYEAHARDCGQSGSGACMDFRVDAGKAMGNMQSALAAWGPDI